MRINDIVADLCGQTGLDPKDYELSEWTLAEELEDAERHGATVYWGCISGDMLERTMSSLFHEATR